MFSSFQERLQVRRNKRKRVDRLAGAAVLLFLLLLGIGLLTQTDMFQKKYIYPYPHQKIIAQYAAAYHVESALVAGVIMSESKFKNEVHSPRGAVGLMQLMPDTARWIAEQLGDERYDMEKLHEAETNIRFGTWYLSSLREEFNGNEVLALAAYNAGRGNVRSWMEVYGWDMSFCDISQIPYLETREYVAKVLKNKEKYQKLYGSNAKQ